MKWKPKTANQILRDAHNKMSRANNASDNMIRLSGTEASRGYSTLRVSAEYEKNNQIYTPKKKTQRRSVDVRGGQIDWDKNRTGVDLLHQDKSIAIVESFSFQNSLQFDGVDSTLTFTNSDSFDSIEQMIIQFWTNGTEKWAWNSIINSNNRIFGAYNPDAANDVLLGFRTASQGNTTYLSVLIDSELNADINHWVIVYDGTLSASDRVALYINRNLIQPTASSNVPSSLEVDVLQSFQIGGFFSNTAESKVCELVVDVNNTLNQSEIDSLYNNKNGANYIDTIGRTPYIYCQLNQSNIDSTATNLGSLGIDGTLNNFDSDYWVEFNPEQPDPALSTDINIILAGQSNAKANVTESGRDSGLDTSYANSLDLQDGVYDTMTFNINDYPDTSGGYGVEWAITDALEGSLNIAWLKYAKGGSGVGSNIDGLWADTGELTRGLMNAAYAGAYSPDWMIWVQGEADSVNEDDANNYQSNLTNTFNVLRNQFGSDLKIIIVRLYDFPSIGAFSSTIQSAQDAIASSQTNTYIIDPVVDAGITGGDLIDGLHYGHSGITKIANVCVSVITSN